MRQGQQHRRGRGRSGHNGNQSSGSSNNNNNNNNNSRKIQNPLSRTYQSNGPDGKVSGSPQSIADKYLSLARDALSSGDPVLAENYLQHAEHYNRIILAYREQVAQAQDEANGAPPRPRLDNDGGGAFPDEDTDTLGRDLSPLPPEQPRRPPLGDQPRVFEQPRDGGDERSARYPEGGRPAYNNDRQRPPRDRFGDRGGQDRGGQDRGGGQDRPIQERSGQDRERYGDRDRDRDRYTPGNNGNGDRDRFVGRVQAPAYGPDGQLLPDRLGEQRPHRDQREGNGDRQNSDRHRDSGRDRHFRPSPPARFEGQSQRDDGSRDGGFREGGSRDPAQFDSAPRDVENRDAVTRDGPPRDTPPRDVPVRDVPVREASLPAEPLPEMARVEPNLVPMPEIAERAEAVRPAPRRRERAPALAEDNQPEFLRRPVRRPRREAAPDETAAVDSPSAAAPIVPEQPIED